MQAIDRSEPTEHRQLVHMTERRIRRALAQMIVTLGVLALVAILSSRTQSAVGYLAAGAAFALFWVTLTRAIGSARFLATLRRLSSR